MKKYWLAINKIPKMGPVTIKKLWEHFGSIDAVWRAKEQSIQAIDGLNKLAIKSFLENRDKIDLELELQTVLDKKITVLTLEDEEYPYLLKNIYDPPPVLYVKGEVAVLKQKSIAIVGTRKASYYGKEMAKKLAADLANLGITVVSGLAAGIDTCAHQTVVANKGKTVAVFGCGVDIIFPSENRRLAQEIETNGVLVSEFPLGARPEKGSFPRRNRVISGLSLGTIVIEGHYKSGAMITAKSALDQGREVFAVPGNIEADQSKGPHWLIKNGAKLVESVDDVLEELNFQIQTEKSKTNPKIKIPISKEEERVVSVLSIEPKHIDRIVLESNYSIPQISSLLLQLEMKKVIRQLPGKTFVLS